MSYVHITRSPGVSREDYHSVVAHLGSEPIVGQESHYVGEVDGSLVIVDVWRSRSDADRFAAERLFPAFAAAGMHPQATTEITAFDETGAGQ